jgi:hypothetical protein
MISDHDLCTTAQIFIKCYGDDADMQAAMRADDYGGDNDTDGQGVQVRIVQAIKQLQRTRKPGEAVN